MSGGRDIFGFPINMPYTSNEAIWEEVKSTGWFFVLGGGYNYLVDLYNIANDEAEFILSVAVFSYPSNIFSVWIYLAAIVESSASYL